MDDRSSLKAPNVPPRDVPSKGLLERESAPAKYNRTELHRAYTAAGLSTRGQNLQTWLEIWMKLHQVKLDKTLLC